MTQKKLSALISIAIHNDRMCVCPPLARARAPCLLVARNWIFVIGNENLAIQSPRNVSVTHGTFVMNVCSAKVRMAHEFFQEIEWDDLFERKVTVCILKKPVCFGV